MAQSLLPKLWGDEKGTDMFSALHKEIDRVFDDFHGNKSWPFAAMAGDNGKITPRMDVKETDGALEVTTELPGSSPYSAANLFIGLANWFDQTAPGRRGGWV